MPYDDDTGPVTERPENRDEYEAACCAITARETLTDIDTEDTCAIDH